MMRRVQHLPLSEWMTSNPLVADQRLRYPPVSNIISGLLLRAGVCLRDALVWPFLPLFVLMALLIYEVYRATGLGPGSAILAISFFVFSSGPGFFDWFVEIAREGLESLTYPGNPFSRRDEYQWYSGNFLAGMLIPQRAFLPGLVLGLGVILTAFHINKLLLKKQPVRAWILSGAVVLGMGLLTATHVHSTLAVGVFLALWASSSLALADRYRLLPLLCFCASALFCLTVYTLLYGHTSGELPMTRLAPWWAETGLAEWLVMWWKLWGVFLPIVLIGLVSLFFKANQQKLKSSAVPIVLAGVFLFVIGNTVLLQPIRWDNSKVFLWCYLLLCPVVVRVILTILNYRLAFVGAFCAVILTSAMTTTGISEILRLLRVDRHRYLIITPVDEQLGEWARNNTPIDSIFLTSPTVNSWPMTCGARPLYLGFVGWMPNFGVDPYPKLEALKSAFEGNFAHLKKSTGQRTVYVSYGPVERSEFPNFELMSMGKVRLLHEFENFRVFRVE